MSATLTALSNNEAYRLGDFSLIGRGEHATIRLEDGEVSRQHATIRRDGANYWVVDVGSANGSYVNDVALTTARVLHTGDRVQFGRSIFVFDQGTTAPDPDSQVANTKTQWGNPAAPKSRPATLFVADLKEFTGISARLSPEQVAALLAEWRCGSGCSGAPRCGRRGYVASASTGQGTTRHRTRLPHWPSCG
ncbi:FHA domain-containing protein [Mesorhizobium muleiense]|uniref:FHA domain-containing protein n=1 Tax=Mesorhizobium muleiense TaxID=1004279 RepID=A0A1G8NYX3_9HYPH|nr:FHA domain-containing protein [Mesorhizobium muleiense]MCF6098156.1 FHA domain-containing protein [Mesorhizobium muleiense]SDI85305.1 FHA domain-containing protein [Mesorhizobium muleiense]